MQDSASFWTDIKNLEEQLSNAPDSFCFAGLSAVYLKAGLIDDALHVAREGLAKHPNYLAGHRAFALACHAKGLNDEALTALQRIVVALPEDIPSQKLLGRILVEAGEQDSAIQVYRIAQEFAPEDMECRLQLEALELSAGTADSTFVSDEGEDEIIEDLEILEEIELIEDDQPESEFQNPEAPPELDTLYGQQFDPLSTSTLAELYVGQGYISKALDIYRSILAKNPDNDTIAERVAELESLASGSVETVPEIGFTDGYEVEEEPTPHEISASDVPVRGVADNALATLDGWLENIRRIKACR